VRQQNYSQWQIREELEYGVTDCYTLGLYVNLAAESYRDVSMNPAVDVSTFEFDGLSLENRFQVLNPADQPVGLTLYLEPAFSGSAAEVEEKILLGQRHRNWKWAFNLIHATGWEDNLTKVQGEFAATFGVARDLDSHCSVGLEFWNQNALPEYKTWEYTAFFLGPVVSFRQEKWWAALTVLPQIYGKNCNGNPDGNTSLVLDDQERVNIRLLLGFSF
jgi:hypothetical protein